MPEKTMPCWIYKSSRKEEMYLYMKEEDSYDELPDLLKQHFGNAIFVIQLELSSDRPLARVDINAVLNALDEQGYYLQMPPKLEPEMYHGE